MLAAMFKKQVDAILNQDSDKKDRLQAMLRLGMDYFNQDVAIISDIDQDANAYTVLICAQREGDGLEPGMHFPYRETYCSFTYNADRPITFAHAGNEIAEHPCYQNFKLESYIGSSYCIDGKRRGTINFSSPTPRVQGFAADDIAAIKLLATSVESLLS